MVHIEFNFLLGQHGRYMTHELLGEDRTLGHSLDDMGVVVLLSLFLRDECLEMAETTE